MATVSSTGGGAAVVAAVPAEAGPLPPALVAVTRNSYAVLATNPVTV